MGGLVAIEKKGKERRSTPSRAECSKEEEVTTMSVGKEERSTGRIPFRGGRPDHISSLAKRGGGFTVYPLSGKRTRWEGKVN